MGAMGGDKTSLNAIRPCGMKVPPNGALNINISPCLIINYLLKDE